MLILVRFRLIAIFLACVCIMGGCKSLDGLLAAAPRPTARVLSAELKNFSLEGVDLVFHVEVANPYSANLPLADLTYALNSAGNTLLQGGIKPTGTVPARGTTVVQLPARIAFASLLKTLKSATPGSVIRYQADLSLSVEAPLLGPMTLPLSHSGEFPVPAVPHIGLTSLAINKLALDQVTATVRLSMRNPNQFPVDLSSLGLRITLGGMDVGSVELANRASFSAGGDTALEVPVSFAPHRVGRGVMNLLLGSRIDYAIAGTIRIDSRFGPLTLPLQHAGSAAVSR